SGEFCLSGLGLLAGGTQPILQETALIERTSDHGAESSSSLFARRPGSLSSASRWQSGSRSKPFGRSGDCSDTAPYWRADSVPAIRFTDSAIAERVGQRLTRLMEGPEVELLRSSIERVGMG